MTEAAKIESLLRELAGSFIEHPEALQIAAQHAEDGQASYWAMKCHPDDEAKLVGREGCHVDALMFIVSSLGKVREKKWTFRLLTKRGPTAPFESARDALTFNPQASCDLLRKLIVAFQIPALVEVGPGNGSRDRLTFVFTIKVTDEDYYRAMTLPIDDDANPDQTLITAICTIWRASARFNGVRFNVNVVKI